MSNNSKQDSPESSVRVAALQMNSGNNMKQNLELAARLLVEAATDGCETRPVFLGKKVWVFVFNSRQGSPVYRRI